MIRTLQSLLQERRANVLESMRSPDATAREMLLAQIAEIDREIERRHMEPREVVQLFARCESVAL